ARRSAGAACASSQRNSGHWLPLHGKQIREARDAHTFVGLQPVLVPELGQQLAAQPSNRVGRHVVGVHHLEPVAKIRTSTSWDSPSVVATPAPVNLSIGSVISRTLSRLNVDR